MISSLWPRVPLTNIFLFDVVCHLARDCRCKCLCATCTRVHNEQNGKNSVFARGACFIGLGRCGECKVGTGRGYTHLTENTASPPVLLQHCLHQMSKYYFTLGGKNKQTGKPCFQAHRKNKNNLPLNHHLFLSPSSVCFFIWKINGKTVTETQHKVSMEVAAAGHSAEMEVVRGKSPVASWPY